MNEKKFSRPVTISIIQNGLSVWRKFETLEGLQEFVVKTRSEYNWLANYSNNEKISELKKWIDESLLEFQNLIAEGGKLDEYEHNLEVKAERIFGQGGLPFLETRRLNYLKYLRDEFDNDTAIGGLLYYTNRMILSDNSSYFYGSILAASNDNIDRVDVAKLASEIKNGQEYINNIIESKIQNIQDITKKYEAIIPLKASVEYWDLKSKVHKESSDSYRKIIVSQGPWYGGALLVILIIITLTTHFSVESTASIGAYIGPATIGVLLTSVALWIARICVRLYMSEHHLYIDAAERAVMIKTYSALIQEGVLTKEDRTLVLAPIFRSSADGIVKDDGAPDATIAALLSKILAK